MTVFGEYSAYYDLLNSGKDYEAEVAYVRRLLGDPRPGMSVLDLGCGTGIHASLLAASGLEVCGVDRSPSMLEAAERRRTTLPRDVAARLSFREGDVCTFRAGRRFDFVISLFHVLSYHTAQDALEGALATARAHLPPGGMFVFDCWYGPAVLTHRPERRVKHLENDAFDVTRVAEPTIDANANVVGVAYQVTVREKANDRISEFLETHRMRYFFVPELIVFLHNAGLDLRLYEEWMTGGRAGFDTWSLCCVASASGVAPVSPTPGD